MFVAVKDNVSAPTLVNPPAPEITPEIRMPLIASAVKIKLVLVMIFPEMTILSAALLLYPADTMRALAPKVIGPANVVTFPKFLIAP